MRKALLTAVLVLLLSSMATASVNSFETYLNGSQTTVFEDGQTASFVLNATDSSSANITINDSQGSTVVDAESMNLLEDSGYQVYRYNYSFSNPAGGDWSAVARLSGNTSATSGLSFHVATDFPRFLSFEGDEAVQTGENATIKTWITDSGNNLQNVDFEWDNGVEQMKRVDSENNNSFLYSVNVTPSKADVYPYTVSAEDSAGNTNSYSDSLIAYEAKEVDVKVEVAPSCGTSLAYFLLPGDGEIVQNKTGVFVEIAENSGNVVSNISVDYLRVTSEGDEPWSEGEPIGPVIKRYDGERFENVDIGESVTYFKLFQASYDYGNYTGRSRITTECSSPGPQDRNEEKEYLNESFKGENVTQDNFTRWNLSTVSTSLVTSEVTSTNFTNTTSETVSEQASGTEGYESEINLNSTDYSVFVFNSTSTTGYDYSCASNTSSISDEDDQCAYLGNVISEYTIEVSDIGHDGSNATYALMTRNSDLLNTTVECDSLDNVTAECDYLLKFLERFSFYGNFEIVDAIGDEQGGANESGNETTNQTIEGNNDAPGQTPEPEPEPVPEPVPEPEPEPEPVVRIEIDSVKDRYSTRQGEFVEAEFEVKNVGNTDVRGITLNPLTGQINENWNVREAQITNLSVNETVTRDVFIQPSNQTEPGEYVVPVEATQNSNTLDLDYFTLNVEPASYVPKVGITESPQQIELNVEEQQNIPVLIENIGKEPLDGVSARLQNIEDCGSLESETIEGLDVNESASLEVTVTGSESPETCETTLVVSSRNGAYAFGDITVSTVPEPGLIPREQRVPFLAILWTFVLALYAYSTREYDLDNLMVKIPFLFLIMGETLIIIYSIVNYYGIEASSVLPF